VVAAKVCGRWRNGVPLILSPHSDAPEPPLPEERYNDFDYAGDDHADPRGVRCPVGSHIRRTNPRSSRVAGGGGTLHRLVRRGLPFGPPFDPNHPDDGIARGLVGMFIGVSPADQFEFVMAEWVDNGRFAPGLGVSTDPLIGAGSGRRRRFEIAVGEGPSLRLKGFASFVRTLGGVYCFLPSLTALRWLADGT
jgi:deferrochelatase/peroxidase EfeB